MLDEGGETYACSIAYAIVYRFLHLVHDQESYDEDLDNVLCWGAMNSAGTMTYDPAYLDDWRQATGGVARLSSVATYDAMVRFLEGYASRGCRASFTRLIERLKMDRPAMSSMWRTDKELVAEDIESGEPYRGTYTFGTDPEGHRARIERDPQTGYFRTIVS